MVIPFRNDYPPRNDVVFSIIFGNRDMFAALLKAVTGHELKTDKVFSQANIKPEHVEHNYIRFDTFSIDGDVLYSIDLQNSYSEIIVINRTIYYVCRSISGQIVKKGEYDKLKSVVVSFIMTNKDQKKPIDIIKLRDENNKVYSDLLTIYNVYVPTVNESEEQELSGDIRIFSAFFSIKNEKEMEDFIDRYAETKLGADLIHYYAAAIRMSDIDLISKGEYFDMKITEEDINEAKIEARIEGRAEGRAEGQGNVLKQLIAAGFSKNDLKKALGLDDSGIEKMLSAAV